MEKGFLIFAENNEKINYVDIASANAAMIKYHTGCGTTLITNDESVISLSLEQEALFDQIQIRSKTNNQIKAFVGYGKYEKLEWRNSSRSDAYELSPYDETILVDADYLIMNDILNQCWKSIESVMMSYKALNLHCKELELPERRLFDTNIPMYWATLVYFKRDQKAEMFFNLVKSIKRNWDHYTSLFNVQSTLFRNDYAFSIAAHLLNDCSDGFPAMPDNVLLTSLPADKIIKIRKGIFDVASKDGEWHYPVQVKQSFHYLNKYDLHDNAQKIIKEYT